MEGHYKQLDAELSLTRKWECQLNFSINEDVESIDLLHFTHYQPDSDQIFLDSNYPKGCSYQFDPIKYNGNDQKCKDKLFKDLCGAAINCECMLTRKKRSHRTFVNYKCSYDFYCSSFFKTDGGSKKNFNYDDLAEGTKVQYKKNHKRELQLRKERIMCLERSIQIYQKKLVISVL